MRTTLKAAVALLSFGLCAAVPAAAAELFRYINEDGVVVISSTLPPRYATRGYAVIDSRGRVLREVQRQLTPEELRARQERETAREAERLAQQRRLAQDEELLRLYGSPEEVARARDRRIDSIEANIATVRAGIARLRTQQGDFQAQAAELERAGRPLPEHIVTALERIDAQLEERQATVLMRQEQIEQTRESFDRDQERIARLLGVPVSSLED